MENIFCNHHLYYYLAPLASHIYTFGISIPLFFTKNEAKRKEWKSFNFLLKFFEP